MHGLCHLSLSSQILSELSITPNLLCQLFVDPTPSQNPIRQRHPKAPKFWSLYNRPLLLLLHFESRNLDQHSDHHTRLKLLSRLRWERRAQRCKSRLCHRRLPPSRIWPESRNGPLRSHFSGDPFENGDWIGKPRYGSIPKLLLHVGENYVYEELEKLRMFNGQILQRYVTA